MTKARLNRIEQVLKTRQLDVGILLDQVHKSHNLSAIMRTCDAVGVSDIQALETKAKHLKVYNNATGGTGGWVNLQVHNKREDAFKAARNGNRKVYAAHLSDKAVDYQKVDYTKPCVILLGAEKPGVSDEAADMADEHIIIPMHGMVESLNVSVAAAVILFEMQRQRLAAGLYNQMQLSEAEFEKLKFEWMQPKMARHCIDKNLPYPELDEDGDLIRK